VVVLLGIYPALAVSAMATKSVAFDELAHLTAGYSYWTTGDFRLQPENGNLPQRWAGLGVLSARPVFPSTDQPAWWGSSVWELSEQFLFKLGNDADTLLFRGRLMVVALGACLGLLVWAWSRRLFGPGGAVVSLAAYAFSPTMLAHGSLATSDMAAALFFAASLLALWIVLHRVTPWTVLASCLAMAGLFLSKMSAVLIIPVGLLLVLLRLAAGRPLVVSAGRFTRVLTARRPQLLVLACLVAVHVLVVWVAIWAAFDFRYSAFRTSRPGRDTLFPKGWEYVLEAPGVASSAIRLARDHGLLPEAYLYGFAMTNRFSQERRSFLNGECGSRGWWTFFPYCLLVKTPLPEFGLLALAGAAGVAVLRSRRDGKPPPRHYRATTLYDLTPLVVFLAVYWAAALASHLNIGHRHLLPTYPSMFVLAGGAAFWLRRPAERLLPVLTLVALAWVSLWTWPNYLAFFNVLAAGPAHGYEHLVDSSLDWGQDLRGLGDWLKERGLPTPDRPVYLSYFGTGSPEYYDIHATLLPCYFSRGKPDMPRPLTGGVYCISATMLQGVYLPTPAPWTRDNELLYQRLRTAVRDLDKARPDPAGGDSPRRPNQQTRLQLVGLFEQVRFCRLCAFLRKRQPDGQLGHSILMYDLSAADVQRAVNGPPP
jgi:hypothetical protein